MTTINTNFWNRVRYTLYAPFYDRIVGLFEQSRQRSLSLLQLLPSETVLIVGAGTGADLTYLPPEVQVTAVDLTPQWWNTSNPVLKGFSFRLMRG
jgi:phosphatidylethanolamine/phosphatidyl-N-methylethanolamine N-methyltransferase